MLLLKDGVLALFLVKEFGHFLSLQLIFKQLFTFGTLFESQATPSWTQLWVWQKVFSRTTHSFAEVWLSDGLCSSCVACRFCWMTAWCRLPSCRRLATSCAPGATQFCKLSASMSNTALCVLRDLTFWVLSRMKSSLLSHPSPNQQNVYWVSKKFLG